MVWSVPATVLALGCCQLLIAASAENCSAPTHPGIAFNQDDIKHLTGIASFQICCTQCVATEGCRAYTHTGQNCYLKTAPNQPRADSGSVSSVIGALPCSALLNKTACESSPSWEPCTWKCQGGISPTCPGHCEAAPPAPPPPPPPCKYIAKQGQCSQVGCTWSGGHCEPPPPPPPPIPVSKRTWMNTADPPAVRAQKLLRVMSVEEKLHMWAGNNSMFPYVGAVTSIPRLGIPPLNLNDGPQGFRGQGNDKPGRPLLAQKGTTTAFPSGLTIAATWDVKAARLWGETMGEEFRDKGSNVQLGPGLCVSRIPQNGRNFEYMSGEDPNLGATLAPHAIQGIQSKGVIANAKHWVDNSQETNRTTNIANVDERTQMEVYYPPFEAAVKAGVGSIMCSYNKIAVDGNIFGNSSQWSCENPDTLRRDLKERIGHGKTNFWVMSDWGAQHHGAPGGYGQGGLDQSMPGGSAKDMKTRLAAGGMTVADVDESTIRILTPMFQMGLFESVDANGDLLNKSRSVYANVTSAEHNKIARRLAGQAMTVLKNEKEVLPLDAKALKTIAVIGTQAAPGCAVHGGGSGQVFPYYVSDPLAAIRARFAGTKNCSKVGGGDHCVLYDDGKDLESIATTCQHADVGIVFVMANSGEGSDRATLELTNSWGGKGPTMTPLIQAAAKACKKTVVVMVSPGTVLTPWRDQVDAIIAAIMPGQEYGNAISDVLFGDVASSGRLPFTMPAHADQMPFTQEQWPGVPAAVYQQDKPTSVMGANGFSNYTEKLLVGHRYYDAHGLVPAFCFGHGLSLSLFAYTHLTASRAGGVTFTLKNIGKRAANEVVQLYLRFPQAAQEPPKVLRSFEVVPLEAGMSRIVTLPLTERDISIWDVSTHTWMVVNGEFAAMVGASSCDIRLNATFVV